MIKGTNPILDQVGPGEASEYQTKSSPRSEAFVYAIVNILAYDVIIYILNLTSVRERYAKYF